MSFRSTPSKVGLATLAGCLAIPAGVTFAQDELAIEEITVTARKRSESLTEVPVAISAFSAQDIQAADLDGLEDLTSLAAGFQFFNQGNQQPGRYNTQLQFRGLTTAQFSPSFATGALFIDGIYVLNGGTSVSLMDLERIEVIKGPQSAYFGRNTFGGAVNLITRDPSLEEFSGEASISATNRSNFDASVFVEGPIVPEKLSFSASARRYDKDGHYIASDGGRLGNEETTTFNGVLKFQPLENLSFKLRYADSEDDDGAPAQAFVSGIANDTCTGTTIQTAEGPANPQRYVCGVVPDIDSAIAASSAGVVGSANTILPQGFVDAGLTDPATRVPGTPQVDSVGLKRETERISLKANWDIGDYSLEFSAGSNEQSASWIRDFDLTDRVNWFSRDPQLLDDESYEIRLTGPQDGRIRWLVGANKYEQTFLSSGAGGDAGTACFSFASDFTDDFATCIPGLTLLFNNTLQNSDNADVFGLFAAVDIDITDQWTLIFEGRDQEDELTKGTGVNTPGEPVLTDSYEDFLPRVIARFQPNESTNLYLSYSEGLIAGDFNTFIIDADERELAQYRAQDPTITEALPAEELEAIEFGWKQTFWDGRGQVNLAVYRNEWTGIKGRSTAFINETCDAIGRNAIGVTGCQYDGVMPGDPKLIDDGSGNLIPFLNSRNYLIPGDGTINGVEIESLFLPTQGLTVGVNISYIDFEYDDYVFNFIEPIADFSQVAGAQSPRQPEWSGNITVRQDFEVRGLPAYVRGDVRYQGETFVDESNLAFIDSYSIVNLRAGLDTERYLVELYVTNLTDEDAWATGSRWTDFSSPTQFGFLTAKQGIALSPLDKREVGLRAIFRF